VTIGAGGVLYGTTNGNGIGTVFSLSPPSSPGGAWSEHVLHVFGSNADGSNPGAGVTIGAGGVLYGTTQFGGSVAACGQEEPGCGTVFSLTPPTAPGGAWTEAVLYTFPGTSSDGCGTQNLAIGKEGELYGTSYSGGASGAGTVFSLTPPRSRGGRWAEKVLYSFGDNSAGFAVSVPSPGLAIGRDGVLYGTTGFLGTTTATCGGGCGTVFSLTPPASPGSAWTEAVLYSFAGAPNDGSGPLGVVFGSDGVLYGATSGGGAGACGQAGCGTIFSLTPPADASRTWTEAVLCNLTLPNAYVNPGLAVGKDGVIFGATSLVDTNTGTVFALEP